MKYEGVPTVSSNNSLMAIDTDDLDGGDCAPEGVGLYDATDLTYLGPREGGGSKTILAGPTKDNLFITVNMKDLTFHTIKHLCGIFHVPYICSFLEIMI